MMAGNPNSWSMNGMHPQSHQLSSQFVYGSNSSNPSSTTAADHHHQPQDFPVRSWSQFLLGGLGVGEEERFGATLFHQHKKLDNWEDQVLNLNPTFPRINDVKQEAPQPRSCQINEEEEEEEEFHPNKPSNSWPTHHHHQGLPVSSPTSCITSLSNKILNFSGSEKRASTMAMEGKKINHHHNQDHSSECNSTNSGGVSKKAKVQHSSAQPAFKVRKEKLGDRITALHQIVSPFGKTDTASVLSEAIGYIRFLQGQIEALSSPYMRNAPQHYMQETNCLFPEEGGLQDAQGVVKDLRNRGLCLVPISCTLNVGNDTGADYWAPAPLDGRF